MSPLSAHFKDLRLCFILLMETAENEDIALRKRQNMWYEHLKRTVFVISFST